MNKNQDNYKIVVGETKSLDIRIVLKQLECFEYLEVTVQSDENAEEGIKKILSNAISFYHSLNKAL